LPNEVINNPKRFFNKLGDLHDARVEKFSWDMKGKALCISVDDLNSNILDLPDDQGLKPADIVFMGVVLVDINVQIMDDIFRIYDMEFVIENGVYDVKIGCSPGGYFKCKCRGIELRNI
jgi:hypothetical protein